MSCGLCLHGAEAHVERTRLGESCANRWAWGCPATGTKAASCQRTLTPLFATRRLHRYALLDEASRDPQTFIAFPLLFLQVQPLATECLTS